MTSVTVTGNTKSIPKEIEKQLLNAMLFSTSHLENKVAEKTPVNFGILRNSITSKSTLTRGVVFAQNPGAKYVEFVERGRRPGKFPPWGVGSSLELWVRRVLKVSGKRLRSTSYLVARKIAKKVTKAVEMFETTEKQEKNKVIRFYQRAIGQIERVTSDV